MSGKYYDPYRVITKDRAMSYIIGGRKIGKTFGFKRALIKLALKNGTKLAYIRRRKVELDNIMDFMDKLREDPEFSKYEIVEKKINEVRTVQFNGEVVVVMFALSQSANLRSSGDFVGFDTVWFDEFLPEDGRYVKNEVEALLNISETIFRETDKPKMYLTANSKQLNNPYFEYWNLYPQNREFTYDRERGILIQIVDMKAPSKTQDNAFEKLIAGTSYGMMSSNNEFSDDNNDYVEPLPDKAVELATLVLDERHYGLWAYVDKIYISYKTSNHMKYSMDGADLTLPYFFRDDLSRTVAMSRNKGNLRFDNAKIREAMRLFLI